MFVYRIVNSVTGKIYVGQHKHANLKQYLQKKFYAARKYPEYRSHLYASMRKHGRDAFSIEPFAAVHGDMPKAVLDSVETFCIAFLDTRNPDTGYNICRGGEGFTGPHSPATRDKIATASKKMWQRPEIKTNFTAKVKGHTPNRSPEGLEAIRRGRLGVKAGPETIEKLRISHIGHASPRRKSVRCIDTDEVFPSVSHVVERFGGCTTNLSRSIREGHLFFGRRFEYARQTLS